MWPFLPAPGTLVSLKVASMTADRLLGADDDGSGSMSILEAYRALIAANFRPERAVEFHWYSAEVRLCFRGSEA